MKGNKTRILLIKGEKTLDVNSVLSKKKIPF